MVETDVRDHPGEMRCAFSDPLRNVSGPSFAGCAHCEYQVGINYQVLGADVVSGGNGDVLKYLNKGAWGSKFDP